MHKLARQCGFTLLEMLIAIAIVGILIGVALPSFMETIGQAGTSGAVKSMNGALSMARSEAITRASTIFVCPANADFSDCEATNWSQGWLVFSDNNGDANGASGSIDVGDEVLRVFQPVSAVVVTATTNLLGFNSRGFATASATQTLKFCPRDNNVAAARALELNLAGSARLIQGGLACP